MTHAMRPSTLETLGLGSVFDIFTRGGLPARAGELVDRVFGPATSRPMHMGGGATATGNRRRYFCRTTNRHRCRQEILDWGQG